MTFRIPQFNSICRIWRAYGAGPLPPPPDTPALASRCQLRLNKAPFLLQTAFGLTPIMELRFPKGTDIRGPHPPAIPGDLVEVPALLLRFYLVTGVDDVARGFDNEYRLAAVVQLSGQENGWPYPTP